MCEINKTSQEDTANFIFGRAAKSQHLVSVLIFQKLKVYCSKMKYFN